MKYMVRIAALILLLPSYAWALSFAMPIACDYGKNCFIQNYVDSDAGYGVADYHCGALSYNGHTGTDFRLPSFAAMEQGVNVLAAADGTVLRLRNDAPDTGLDAGRAALGKKECGNGVVIAHAENFQTQYCHMKQGSITVHVGATVKAGDMIGQVGFSGMSEFPHVHFQVNHRGNIIDPFNTSGGCTANPRSLWAASTLKRMPYTDTAILRAGFSDAVPQRDRLKSPLAAMPRVAAVSPILALWMEIIGLQQGDVIAMRITAPDGAIIAETHASAPKAKAFFFQYIGKKMHAPLAAGTYYGDARIERNGSPLPFAQQRITMRVVP